jgi:hypothetical protein
MGKKSRQKRERKATMKTEDQGALFRKLHSLREHTAYHSAATEKSYQEHLQLTRTVLRQYNRLDAALALNVSDLWPANVASPVKHIFAWAVLLDLEPGQPEAKRIESYSEFSAFVQGVYAVWPEFPTLEDFAPEADWGQVRVRLNSKFVPMFYGSCIERTPDFVESFRISFAHVPEALAQMDLAVAIQTAVINAIPDRRALHMPEPSRGHVEVPPSDFWSACQSSLLQITNEVARWRHAAGARLDSEFGTYKAPLSRDAFGDAIMQGVALPFLAVSEVDHWMPISIRSGPGNVIDHWAGKDIGAASSMAHRRLALFVMERFRNTVIGPLTLIVGGTPYTDLPVSCIIPADSQLYLISLCNQSSNEQLFRATKRLYSQLRQGLQIQFKLPDGRFLQLAKDGKGPSADELHILFVLSQSGTAFNTVLPPEKPARLMPLADFVAIFDSVEELSELDRYWKFIDEQRMSLSPFSTGAADLFATFRDTHGVLVDGAMSPNLIMLDTSWGTSWRFKELATFWALAPREFPDGSCGWRLDESTEGVVRLESRHHKALAYSTMVSNCTTQAIVPISKGMTVTDGRLVDLFAQLLVDGLHRCRMLIDDAPMFERPHLVFTCEPAPGISCDTQPPEPLDKFPNVIISALPDGSSSHKLRLQLDVRAILAGLNAAVDGAFEIRCLVETLTACHAASGLNLPVGLAGRLQAKTSEQARYHLRVVSRHVDVPDYVDPIVPSSTEYKLARKQLAVEMKDLGLTPGRYELSHAKSKIDLASGRLRGHIENRLASYDRHQLLSAFVEQHDAVLAAERVKIQRARQSLAHAVEYDRLDAVESARKEFGSAAKHYRYLLEKVVSSPVNGTALVEDNDLRKMLGLVDWYMVLTGASDVLHNGVDVGGVEIDDSFVPEVFYSSDSGDRGDQFAREFAKARLGIDIDEQDAVEGASVELLASENLRQVFLTDAGFELQNLISSLAILSQAQRHGFSEALALSYAAEAHRIAQVLADCIEDLQLAEANMIVQFLTLSGDGVRRLAGRNVVEAEVPYWEHSKRIHRYAIRPLISDGSLLRWGAESASRALNVWMSSVRDGYMPADFGWPKVDASIKQIKQEIEKRLESRAEEIFRRHTPYVVRGIDFFDKYRGEGFEDVGDFDTLAYWPDKNILIAVECKYNKPTFTMKDGRRLRDQIFGKSETDRAGQFSRLLRRRQFMSENRQRMIELLLWPTAEKYEHRDVELYVGRDVNYWMIHPPYPVPTKFVRIDALDSWIRNELSKSTDD